MAVPPAAGQTVDGILTATATFWVGSGGAVPKSDPNMMPPSEKLVRSTVGRTQTVARPQTNSPTLTRCQLQRVPGRCHHGHDGDMASGSTAITAARLSQIGQTPS